MLGLIPSLDISAQLLGGLSAAGAVFHHSAQKTSPKFLSHCGKLGLISTAWTIASSGGRIFSGKGRDRVAHSLTAAGALLAGLAILGNRSMALQAFVTFGGLIVDGMNLGYLGYLHHQNPTEVSTTEVVIQAALTVAFGVPGLKQLGRARVYKPVSPEGVEGPPIYLSEAALPERTGSTPQLTTLLKGEGRELDEAIEAVLALPAEGRNRILHRAIGETVDQIRIGAKLTAGTPLGHSLVQNYRLRLRATRLIEVLLGHTSSVVLYPLSGYDVLPALYYRKVVGIDARHVFRPTPAGREAAREAEQWNERLFNNHLESVGMLRDFDRVAYSDGRFESFRGNTFEEAVAQRLCLTHPSPRTLIIKGMSWVSRDFPSVDHPPIWLASRYTRQGDFLIIMDGNAEICDQLLKTGYYEPVSVPFLSPQQQARLWGEPNQETDFLIPNPFDERRISLYFNLTNQMTLLRRKY